jgi:hypothetical protein
MSTPFSGATAKCEAALTRIATYCSTAAYRNALSIFAVFPQEIAQRLRNRWKVEGEAN